MELSYRHYSWSSSRKLLASSCTRPLQVLENVVNNKPSKPISNVNLVIVQIEAVISNNIARKIEYFPIPPRILRNTNFLMCYRLSVTHSDFWLFITVLPEYLGVHVYEAIAIMADIINCLLIYAFISSVRSSSGHIVTDWIPSIDCTPQ